MEDEIFHSDNGQHMEMGEVTAKSDDIYNHGDNGPAETDTLLSKNLKTAQEEEKKQLIQNVKLVYFFGFLLCFFGMCSHIGVFLLLPLDEFIRNVMMIVSGLSLFFLVLGAAFGFFIWSRYIQRFDDGTKYVLIFLDGNAGIATIGMFLAAISILIFRYNIVDSSQMINPV